jgi:small acid-soluble spore protein F (minor alpha/beta-type SASP)
MDFIIHECFFVFGPYYACQSSRGGKNMSRKRVMSDRLKEEIAKELGFYEVVERDGWGGITSRDAGNMVKRAVEMAQTELMNRENRYKN